MARLTNLPLLWTGAVIGSNSMPASLYKTSVVRWVISQTGRGEICTPLLYLYKNQTGDCFWDLWILLLSTHRQGSVQLKENRSLYNGAAVCEERRWPRWRRCVSGIRSFYYSIVWTYGVNYWIDVNIVPRYFCKCNSVFRSAVLGVRMLDNPTKLTHRNRCWF